MLVGVTKLIMQMRTTRAAAVAAQAQNITGLHRNLVFLKKEVLPERLACKLLATHIFPNFVVETVEMRVNRHKPIIMSDIHHVAVAVRRHPDAAHIAIGDSINTIAGLAVSLDIDTGMKGVVSKLAKSRGKINRNLDRIRINRIIFLILSA